ncbi:hypothetical protein GGR57DRAFT_497031 [Xylariaceae sp. FL1272]|nr:hypothetical protein GGR57DRAFT_497031 [Xylariaceae sp. FL1272]
MALTKRIAKSSRYLITVVSHRTQNPIVSILLRLWAVFTMSWSIGLWLFAATAIAKCVPSSPSSIEVFIDFDGTIVTSDAYTTLATAAYATLPNNSTVLPWDEIEEQYEQRADAAGAAVPTPTSLASAIAYANDASLRDVEVWSFNWVKGMGLFETAKADELVKFARNQTLRDGWCSFARKAEEEGVNIHVVSLNWSPSWIRLVLEEASGCADAVSRISIYCPEILPQGVLPISRLNHNASLFSGGDKAKLIKRLLKDVPTLKKVVFVSDGDADLEPIWDGPINVGIVAGYDNSAAQEFEEYGVSIWKADEGWKGFTGAESNAVCLYPLDLRYETANTYSLTSTDGFENWVDVAKLLWKSS